ncbi:tannase/feruloyl esterase family alpha/beta hydrolase [Sphingopyxis granuli]|uniref:tannase/feruloyl esterase family alpha/beta hydrolase n=1 Tax=Sphingopyxis granuli TaxID=267128 RepID=UPI00301BAA59
MDTRSKINRLIMATLVAGCGAFAAPTVAAQTGAAPAAGLRCDDSLKAAFKPDANTTVIQVKQVRKGEPYPNKTMEQIVYPNQPAVFGADLCLVKLLVTPGIAGPEGAPSTSAGIGIEVWLPDASVWNQRVHAIGGSGTSNGTEEIIPDKISSWTGAGGDIRAAPRVAAEEGAVTSTTDSGQQVRSGAFMLKPDGTLNPEGIRDWNYRGLYEQAVKTKALATAFYGRAPAFSYYDGASGGGRQAMHVAQNLPEQYDGILSRVPAMNWSEFIAQLYPTIVINRDLGGKAPSQAQLDIVSNAAIAACDVVGGKHMGFITDFKRCRYDPTKDAEVLCTSDGGRNRTDACVSVLQARAINKFWYGITSDGSVPDPAIDNGWDAPPTGVRRWFGMARGSDLSSIVAGTQGSGVGTDMVAIALGDISLGNPGFVNASGLGKSGWTQLSYQQLAAAFDRGRGLQQTTGISANNPDLSRLRNAGTKLLHIANVYDEAIYSMGDRHYFEQVVAKMGGLDHVHPFYRFFWIPGLSHGLWSGSANRDANPPTFARGQMYEMLVDWVEKDKAPGGVLSSTALRGTDMSLARFKNSDKVEKTMPLCAYPTAATYTAGDSFKAESYVCR